MEQRTASSKLDVGDYRITVSVAGCTDTGSVRSANEDNFLARGTAGFVADGMGGHRFGDRASLAAVERLGQTVGDDAVTTPTALVAAIGSAHASIMSLALGEGISGTTLTGVALVEDEDDGTPRWMVLNVGDSRVYEITADAISQITVDHSAVQELVEAGEITALEAEIHPERNVITRALGYDDTAVPDVWLLPLRDAQGFLVCSDGLTKELSDAEIAAIVSASSPADAPEALISAALDKGGRDNVTVVVLDATAERADGADAPELAGSDQTEDTLPRAR